MAVKKYAFSFISAILAVLVVLNSYTTYTLQLALSTFKNHSILAKSLSKKSTHLHRSTHK